MITFIESGNRIATENFETGEIYTITYTNETIRTMCCIGIGSDFVMFQGKAPNTLFCLTLGTSETVLTIDLGGGGGSTMNYNELENKPQINGIVLIGNKTASDLNLVSQNDLDSYVTDTELSTELADYATNASVVSALASKQDQLTTAQLTAVNSGITSSLVTQIGTNTTAIAGKQDTLTTPQLTAVNSGITSSLVTQIGTNTAAIAGKQDTLTTPQLTAVNSGITSSLVTQIGTNTTAIASKQDTLTTPQLTAVNSGITSSLVTQIGTNTTAIAGKQDTLTTPQLTAVNSGITRLLVNQITTNKNNISKVTPVTLSKRHKPQSANYEIVSDLTISIPAGKKYMIHATAMFNNVAPKGVIINKTNAIATNKNTVFAEINGGETDYGGLTASAVMSNTGSSVFDICIFVKYKSANTSGSDVIVTYQDITESV